MSYAASSFTRLGALSVTALCANLVVVGPARAESEPRDPVAAELVFNRALAALKEGDWDSACRGFEKSYALDPAASTMAKIASCREQEGKLATAWYDYQRALKLVAGADYGEYRRLELARFIRDASARLEPRVPRLRVIVRPDPAGLEVLRDGRPVPPAALGEWLFVDPGQHEILARAPGFLEQRVTVMAVESGLAEATIELVSAPRAKDMGQDTRMDQGADAPRWTQRHTAVAVGGLGVASLGVAAYFGIRTLTLVGESSEYCNTDDICRQEGVDLRRDAREAQLVGAVVAATGAVLVGTGVVLWTSARHGVAQVAVRAGPGGAFVEGAW